MELKWIANNHCMLDSNTFHIMWIVSEEKFLPWAMILGCTCHPLPDAGDTTYSYDAAITCHGKANKAINTWLNTMWN